MQRSIRSAVLLLTILCLASPLGAQQQTTTVVAGEGYDAGGFYSTVFGRAYRGLWGAPIEVPLLDLDHEGGGLTPVRVVGRLQTLGLAMRGADGRSYTFRGVHKNLVRTLPEELRETAIADIAQDQLVASLPAADIVAVPIARAAGVLQPESKLVVMPDDARLGEFREQFAGLLGTFSEFPLPRPDGAPGTYGAVEILDGFDAIAAIDASAAVHIDARAFARARLIDLVLGDWDRHIGQWRFARIPGHQGLQPIAEDRDQAFSRYEGLAMALARDREPKFDVFGPDYPNLEGLTWNARSVDRRLLSGLERDVWIDLAREIQGSLTDAVIEDAVRRMPAPYFDAEGQYLIDSVAARRDALVAQAERFYEFLSEQVNVFGTDEADMISIDRGPAEVTVTISRLAGSGAGCDSPPAGEPFFRRRFLVRETTDIRLYTGAGDDRVQVSGPPVAATHVRVVGGGGSNLLCDRTTGRNYAFDDSSANHRGAGVKVAAGLHLAPAETIAEAGTPEQTQGTALNARRDWGSTNFGVPWFGFGPDIGLFVGTGRVWEKYGFRKRPYAAQHQLRVGFAFGVLRPRIDYSGYFRPENRRRFWIVRGLASGVERLRFYGFGNETVEDRDDDFYRVRQAVFSAEVRMALKFGDHVTLSTGPTVRYSHTDDDDGDDRLVSRDRPYGSESIAQAGWVAGFGFNNRKFPGHREFKGSDEPLRWGPADIGRGYTFDLDAHYYPDIGGLRDDYGSVAGSFTGSYWIGVSGPGFGFRLGGATTWGDVPYYDAAYLGAEQLRGLRPNRYAGDRSLYGNVSALMPLGRLTLLVPGHWGLLASGGLGRVYLDGEDSDTWHYSYGAGLWFAPWDLQNAVRVFVAKSDEATLFYLLLGMDF